MPYPAEVQPSSGSPVCGACMPNPPWFTVTLSTDAELFYQCLWVLWG